MRNDVALLAEIVELEAHISALQSRQGDVMVELADLRRSEAVAAGSSRVEQKVSFVAEEIAVELNASVQVVQSRLHAARTLQADLPGVWAAHGAGRLDAYRVRLIASTAWKLRRPESLEALDAKVAGYAATHTPAQLKTWLKRFTARVEPDAVVQRRKAAVADRGVFCDHGEDGLSWLHASMATEDALLVEREVRLAAKAAQAGDPAEATRTLAQAAADVVVDRLLGREPGADGEKVAGRGRFHIGLTVPLTSALGLSLEPGTTVEGSLALPPELVREIAAQPGTLFSRILTDPAGGVLDVTELGRFPSPRLTRALEILDGVCAFPTCQSPAVNDDIDHTVPHPNGPTTGSNLWHLCRRHHRFKTLHVVETDVGVDGRHRWQMPTGRTVASRHHLPRTHAATDHLVATLTTLLETRR